MKCHYEVLEVERDADDETIKKNYRKLALRWHPDKNPDNIEECTQQFRLLQAAYDVLSDTREREFYDRHRESILKGKNTEYVEQSVPLFPYFNASCYQGYGDGPNGFYAVYRKIFKILVTEEYDQYDENPIDYPEFGDANSDPEEIVNKFYGFWMSFSTSRSFAWLDHYDITQASNRWESRKIDQENQKYRDIGKQDRNEQIREMTTFARKRDPRVKQYRETLERKKAEAQQKQVENRKKQIAKNRELADAHLNDKEAEAARLAHLIEVSLQMAEDYDTCSDECDEEGEELPYCVVCSKSFKTVNAKLNHENSKQHIRQLNELKKHLKEEDAELFAEKEPQEEQKKGGGGKKNKRKDRKKGNGIFDEGPPNDVMNDVNIVIQETTEGEVETEKECTPEVNHAKEKKKRRADKNQKSAAPEEPAAAVAPPSNEPKPAKCDNCQEKFDTRTKLFAHLKETGHATLLVNKSAGGTVGNGQQKKGKNKKGQRGNKDDDW
ncbi:CRE-DNJ-17 protein [Caenorhabditis remanei]|uniref:DnaJ homolog subfamily C member 21 n=1 Tax=Caenorhabditis remanei TaxID=31234 RepID=E3N356_CAERE|nr:CRE-DNJ-17 protein [Caenorhabditis remanei]